MNLLCAILHYISVMLALLLWALEISELQMSSKILALIPKKKNSSHEILIVNIKGSVFAKLLSYYSRETCAVNCQ